MITVITGTPGAGKTLYAISKLLLPLIGTHVPVTDEDGVTTLHPRIIYTNIRGLLIEHELIDAGDNEGLRDWHTWAKPGAVIVFDEFQKAWPPRANGSKVPDDIQALDTHRHMGVDFILITQNVINTDRHVHGLVGRHLHVRRMANTHLCIVYEWDHCSRQLLYAKSLNKEPWRYSKKVFKLYRSADAHTKQPRKIPGLVWFILLGLGGVAYLGPSAYQRMQDRIAGNQVKPATVAQASPSTVKTAAVASPDEKVSSGEGGASTEPKKPVLAGCVRSKSRCSCYDETGKVFAPEPGICEAETAAPAIVLTGGSFPENAVHREAPAPEFVGSKPIGRPQFMHEIVAAAANRH